MLLRHPKRSIGSFSTLQWFLNVGGKIKYLYFGNLKNIFYTLLRLDLTWWSSRDQGCEDPPFLWNCDKTRLERVHYACIERWHRNSLLDCNCSECCSGDTTLSKSSPWINSLWSIHRVFLSSTPPLEFLSMPLTDVTIWAVN